MRSLFEVAGLFLALALSAVSPAPAAPTLPPSAAADASTGQRLVYTLPPAKLAQARALYRWHAVLNFLWPVWSILALLAILTLGWVARLRDWAVARTSRKWLQGLWFAPLLLLLIALLNLPPALLAHHISLSYGQSVERWPSWFADWGKGCMIDLLSGTVVFAILFAIIRRSRRWWLWFWILSLPTQVFVIFVLPVVIDPMFNHFQPLEQTDPALVIQLERVVAKTGVSIPPSRMFLMKASEKFTGSNAYVTGFGPSKRVVVWDTAIKNSPTAEILFIFGHELGHYVLNHIQRGLVIGSAVSFFFLWVGFHWAKFLVRRMGPRWGIASLEDWGAAALLLLVLAILSFLADPVANIISREQEHEADIFGQEVIHGLVADPQLAAAQSFQRMGEESLDYPDPNPFVVFWTYDHPPTAARKAFARDYDPWQPGKHPRYFNKNEQVSRQAKEFGITTTHHGPSS
jgi:STE24 endopeptidase